MNFDTFINFVPKIIQENLLGSIAHEKMAPLERLALLNEIDLDKINPKKAAVMMLFYPKNNVTHLVLILRNKYSGVHSSQIAFPGGKFENFDASLTITALRETEEEIGIPSSAINIVKAFTEIYIPPSNFIVYPFLGFSKEELIFKPDPSEVAGVVEVSLSEFLNENNVMIKKMDTSYSKAIDVPVFKIEDHIVWGATAMMLNELKEVLKKVF